MWLIIQKKILASLITPKLLTQEVLTCLYLFASTFSNAPGFTFLKRGISFLSINYHRDCTCEEWGSALRTGSISSWSSVSDNQIWKWENGPYSLDRKSWGCLISLWDHHLKVISLLWLSYPHTYKLLVVIWVSKNGFASLTVQAIVQATHKLSLVQFTAVSPLFSYVCFFLEKHH